jgi:hypothetical protein
MIGSDLNIRMRRRGSRTAGPVSLSIFAVVMVVVAAVLFLFSFHIRSQSAKSAYTQAHGVYNQATVVSVNNIAHQSHSQSGSSTTWYTAEVFVKLNPPIRGRSQTMVHVPHSVSYAAGDPVSVLVDPQALSYAELPGQPSVTGKDLWAMLGGAAVFALVGLFLGWQAIKKIRSRRLAY